MYACNCVTVWLQFFVVQNYFEVLFSLKANFHKNKYVKYVASWLPCDHMTTCHLIIRKSKTLSKVLAWQLGTGLVWLAPMFVQGG